MHIFFNFYVRNYRKKMWFLLTDKNPCDIMFMDNYNFHDYYPVGNYNNHF
mgnify:CR=1 FL=1